MLPDEFQCKGSLVSETGIAGRRADGGCGELARLERITESRKDHAPITRTLSVTLASLSDSVSYGMHGKYLTDFIFTLPLAHSLTHSLSQSHIPTDRGRTVAADSGERSRHSW